MVVWLCSLSPLNVIYGHKDDSNEKICNLFPLLLCRGICDDMYWKKREEVTKNMLSNKYHSDKLNYLEKIILDYCFSKMDKNQRFCDIWTP